MRLCKVNHIDIVAQACTVLCRIVVTEDAEALALSDRCLSDERNEIVRNTARELAYECRRMRSDRIEITESDTLDLTFLACSRSDNVTKDILAHLLGISVR